MFRMQCRLLVGSVALVIPIFLLGACESSKNLKRLTSLTHDVDSAGRNKVQDFYFERTIGCTTASVDYSGAGEDCKYEVCVTTKDSHGQSWGNLRQSSLTIQRIPGHLQGRKTACDVEFSEYVGYFDRQSTVTEPHKACFKVAASSMSGIPNQGTVGEARCKFTVYVDQRVFGASHGK